MFFEWCEVWMVSGTGQHLPLKNGRLDGRFSLIGRVLIWLNDNKLHPVHVVLPGFQAPHAPGIYEVGNLPTLQIVKNRLTGCVTFLSGVLFRSTGSTHRTELFHLPNAIRLSWGRLCKKAEIPDLHFHDLRHEAISRFVEMDLSVPEVASISGHRDMRMLMRYAHANTESILAKIQ
jgi:hypothetical protein